MRGEAHSLDPDPGLTFTALVGPLTSEVLKHAPQHPSFDDVCHCLIYPTMWKSFPMSGLSPTRCSVISVSEAAHGDTTGAERVGVAR